MTSTLDGYMMGVWRRRHGHTKVNKIGKIGVFHGGFSGEKTHDVKENDMQ